MRYYVFINNVLGGNCNFIVSGYRVILVILDVVYLGKYKSIR